MAGLSEPWAVPLCLFSREWAGTVPFVLCILGQAHAKTCDGGLCNYPPSPGPLVCRQTVGEAPGQVEAEKSRQDAMQAVLAAPRASEQEGGDAAMDAAQQGDAAMAVDGQAE